LLWSLQSPSRVSIFTCLFIALLGLVSASFAFIDAAVFRWHIWWNFVPLIGIYGVAALRLLLQPDLSRKWQDVLS
jgi:sterol desaturase/sphingolipid hydroxylase (fatty acid hydroxylase superfamily)